MEDMMMVHVICEAYGGYDDGAVSMMMVHVSM